MPNTPYRVSRRGALVGAGTSLVAAGLGAAAVETGVVPGRPWFYRTLGLDGPDGQVPRLAGGQTTSGSFRSERRLGLKCGWTLAYPPGYGGGDGLPVAVVLHGRRNDHRSAFAHDYLALDLFLAAAVADGTPAFALASVDGGDTYWHARASGEDAGAMVVDELVPMLTRLGLDTSRIGLLGWSMGGFGCLHLGQQLGVESVAGVAVMSPALWHSYADTAPGAYDDEADFAAVTPFGRQDELAGIPLRVDCGQGDPFWAATRDYVDGFTSPPAGGFERGDHDVGYWRRMAAPQLAFLGHALGGASGSATT